MGYLSISYGKKSVFGIRHFDGLNCIVTAISLPPVTYFNAVTVAYFWYIKMLKENNRIDKYQVL